MRKKENKNTHPPLLPQTQLSRPSPVRACADEDSGIWLLSQEHHDGLRQRLCLACAEGAKHDEGRGVAHAISHDVPHGLQLVLVQCSWPATIKIIIMMMSMKAWEIEVRAGGEKTDSICYCCCWEYQSFTNVVFEPASRAWLVCTYVCVGVWCVYIIISCRYCLLGDMVDYKIYGSVCWNVC